MRPEFPFRPASVPFFYGWVIVAVSTLGVIMSVPGQTMGVSVFTDHLIAATGLSRLEISNAYLFGTLASGLLLPSVGSWIDKVGVRRGILVACMGLAVTLSFMSQADRLAARVVEGVPALEATTAAFVFLTLGFTGIRFTGQGMLTLVSRTMMARWFDRRRGLVSAVSGPFVNFAFAAAPLGLSLWIGRAGWRGAWLEMALVVGIGMSLVGWLFYRENPEECGLRMDGDALPDASSLDASRSAPAEPVARDYTRSEALRTAAFWLVTLGIGSQAMVGTGITFHIVDMGAELGLTETQAVSIFLPIALISTGVGFLAGMAADRYPIRWLIMAMMLGQVVYFAAMPHVDGTAGRLAAIGGWGFASGFYGPLTVAALPRFFGRTHLGAIQGALMSALVMASALGPSALASLKGFFGSYAPGLYAMTALPILVFLVAPFTRDPQRAEEVGGDEA